MLADFLFFVWDYVPTQVLPCRTRGGTTGVRSGRLRSQGVDRVDLSPRDRIYNTCGKLKLSGRDRRDTRSPRVSPRAPDLSSRGDHQVIGRLAANVTYDRGIRDQINPDRPLTWNAIGRRRQGVEEPTIAVRSSLQSQFFRWGVVSSLSTGDRRRNGTTIVARSRPDRGPIVAEIVAIWKKNWSLGHHQSVTTLKPRSMPTKSHSRRRNRRSRLAPSPTISSPISSWKPLYFPLLFFNFWSTREEIKRASRKVLSSLDPLLPRV